MRDAEFVEFKMRRATLLVIFEYLPRTLRKRSGCQKNSMGPGARKVDLAGRGN